MPSRGTTPSRGTPPARTRTAATRGRPPARRRPPARTRTPRTGPSWWARLAVVAGATLTVATVLAAFAQPPTEAGQVAVPTDPTSHAQFVATTLAEEAARYRAALDDAAHFDAQATQARNAGRAAQAQRDADRESVGRFAAAAYRRTTTERYPLAALSLASPDTAPDVLQGQGLAEQLTDAQDREVGRAALSAVRAAEFTDQAATAEDAADAARRRAAEVLGNIRDRVADLDTAVTAGWAGLSTTPSSSAQTARNQAALSSWQSYLATLAAGGITPPPAADLADPDDLPGGLAPVRDAAGIPVPGIASTYLAGRTVTVLPAETVAAVSAGFSRLGKPFLSGRRGPDGYDCGGFTSTVWTQAGYGLPTAPADQWSRGTPVAPGGLQIGDLVFSTDPLSGLDDVGLYVGGRSVLSASADVHQVGVREVDDLSTAVRVTTPPSSVTPAPVTGPLPATCSAPPAPETPAGGASSGAWGGWANGRIPTDQLCAIGSGPHRLRCDATAAYTAMSAAYELAFGSKLCITDSYRSLDAQVDVHHRKPKITAIPGTSNHGWGLAVDLCGGVNVFGTAQTAWMKANAGRYGWVHPRWARASGSNPEPWHWEYGSLR